MELGTRPKTRNINRKKITLMKEEERKEMMRTTKDIRMMFQRKLDKFDGAKTTTTAATITSTTAAMMPQKHEVSGITSKSGNFEMCVESLL